jgi:hypothetical protein
MEVLPACLIEWLLVCLIEWLPVCLIEWLPAGTATKRSITQRLRHKT